MRTPTKEEGPNGAKRSAPNVAKSDTGSVQAPPARKVSGKASGAANFAGIPHTMRDAERWIVWRPVPDAKHPGKLQKVPVGRWRDPKHWRTYAGACAALRPGQSLGFVLGDGWAGIDVDGAWPAGEATKDAATMREHAREVWDACKAGYVERSPSGSGFKVFAHFDAAPADRQAPPRQLPELGEHVGIEAYPTAGRWFAVTGEWMPGSGRDPDNAKARKGWRATFAALDGAARERVRAIDPGGLADPRAVRPYSPQLAADLRAAFAVLPSDDRAQWVEYGMALKAMGWRGEHAEIAFGIWDDWSEKSAKYPGEEACRETWRGFEPDGRKSVGTIFRRATAAAGDASDTNEPKHDAHAPELETGKNHMRKHTAPPFRTALGYACPVGLGILAGLGGVGKSTIEATWAAHVTNGSPCVPWERSTPTKPRAPAGVLWLTTEENVAGIVLPRHRELGGNMDLIFVPVVNVTRRDEEQRALASDFDIEKQLRPLLAQARKAGTPIRLVVCDALTALINWGNRDDNSDKDVKQVLGRLHDIAIEFECCILGTKHWNKNTDLDATYRLTGAMAWRDSPRNCFLCESAAASGAGPYFVYVTKANDAPHMGTTYEQITVRVLYEIEAETEDGENLAVSARRATFGPTLMTKAKVLDLLALARTAAAQEKRDSKPSAIDRMAAIVECTFAICDSRELPARVVWRAVVDEYHRMPNSEEKTAICRLAGVRGWKGKRQLVRVGAAPAV